jgi:hypothetical protein
LPARAILWPVLLLRVSPSSVIQAATMGDNQAWTTKANLRFRPNSTNGDSGLFLYSPSSYSADFDLDGDVDSDDLTDPILGWEARYGNDLDGTDFLAWQEQFGSGTAALSAPSTAIPEPTAALLLCVSTLILILSRKQIRQLPL